METVIYAIVRLMGEEALDLLAEDLELARAEIMAAIEQHLDEREYIDIGLDNQGFDQVYIFSGLGKTGVFFFLIFLFSLWRFFWYIQSGKI